MRTGQIKLVIPLRTARPASIAAFTMIEIALCLAIIGFALVAIIGVLPTGLNVQKDNRAETIIDQDAGVWMDAICGGARGYDDLVHYVIAITNVQWHYQVDSTGTNLASLPSDPVIYVFTPTDSTVNGVALNPATPLTSGRQIIGLLSTPKYQFSNGGFTSNYIVANIRAVSGSAVEKFPQDNRTILDGAFSYRMIPELDAYVPWDSRATDLTFSATNGLTTGQIAERVTSAKAAGVLLLNAHDVRLTFRWPLLPNGDAGNGRQTFRSLVGGQMQSVQTNQQVLYFLSSFS